MSGTFEDWHYRLCLYRQPARNRGTLIWAGQPGTPGLEKLRFDLANKDMPERFEKVLRCRKGHPLIWLIRTERGIAPMAKRVGKGSYGMRSIDGELTWPAPRTLWPAGRLCRWPASAQ